MERETKQQAAERIVKPSHTPKEAFVLGARWAYLNPIGTIDEEYAWKVYNFINEWKAGKYGEIPLQKAFAIHKI